MSMSINTNMMALNAQRNLNTSGDALATAIQRLSSGLRVNSAKDDAAGAAIAQRFTTQIRGMNQAVRNANDGISIAQVAEGGLSEMTNLLQRMRELALQSANGTNSEQDRIAINKEVTQLYQEIDRLAAAASFNGSKLFTGPEANVTRSMQVGADAGDTVDITIGEIDTKSLGLNSTVVPGQTYTGRVTHGTAATTGDLVFNGVAVSFGAGVDTIGEFESAINTDSATTGVTADAFNRIEGARATVGQSNVVNGLTVTVDTPTGTAGTPVTINASTSLEQLVDNINQQVGGVTAAIGDNGNLILSNTNGGAITIGGTVANSGLAAGTYTGFLALKNADGSDIDVSVATGTDPSALNKFGLNLSMGDGSVTGDSKLSAAAASAAAALTLLGTAAYDPTTNSTDIVTINGVRIEKAASRSAADMAAAINAIRDQTQVTATASTTVALELNIANATAGNDIVINGTTVNFTAADTDLAAMVSTINASGIAGVTAAADMTTGRLILSSGTGLDIVIGNATPASAVVTEVFESAEIAGGSGTTLTAANPFAAVRGRIALTSDNDGSIRIDGDGTASGGTGLAKFGLVAQNNDDHVVGSGLNVLTADSATAALSAIDGAIEFVTSKMADLGVIQNRFASVISNLQVVSENQTAARSRIMDADFAAETAALTRAQIMQQAGTAMLAQANQTAQNVLSLLQ